MATIPLRLVEQKNVVVRLFYKIVRRIKHWACKTLFGGHELYVVRNDPMRIFQECLLCGYRTKGWVLDPRNRRLHVMDDKRTATGGRL